MKIKHPTKFSVTLRKSTTKKDLKALFIINSFSIFVVCHPSGSHSIIYQQIGRKNWWSKFERISISLFPYEKPPPNMAKEFFYTFLTCTSYIFQVENR